MKTVDPIDAALLVGATARITRLITHDDMPGQWFIKDPLWARAVKDSGRLAREVKWARYLEGLDCPHCVGQWIAGGVMATYVATSAHPRARAVWRAVAGALTINAAAVMVGGVTEYWERPDDD